MIKQLMGYGMCILSSLPGWLAEKRSRSNPFSYEPWRGKKSFEVYSSEPLSRDVN